MLVRGSLRSFLFALLVTQVVASNYRRQDPSGEQGGGGRPTGPESGGVSLPPAPTPDPSTPVVPPPSGSPRPTPDPPSPSNDPEPDPEPTPNDPEPSQDPERPNTGVTSPPVQGDNNPQSTVDVFVTRSRSFTPSASNPAPRQTESVAPTEGLSTGSIVGMSVAGGLAVIGIIAFFVWKFTRKNAAAFDDNEPIKWPDLNSHGAAADSHPLPVHNTGRAGFDTGSEVSLSRVNSSNYSTPDFHAGSNDPYAVPPLPHMNPNQPYRDDPTAPTGYYDPYRGPIQDNGSDWNHGDAIPMNQIHAQGAAPQMAYGRQSPGPMQAYDTGAPVYNQQFDAGRQSPGPAAAFGARAASPGPNVMYNAAYNPAAQTYGPR
ncbi:hypothetical protein FA15DRAFT_665688 [Coprinopsis marcescibilis]|uniref:Mid2 domain-containing protein n=1 Tax=Coprinopsis marcescibilis TaxID=230819 RepID=A0A5C3L6C7_COPMA|nr:hypothetical protein FA15DRAFT_665688 [Coprinopsis marcescibilis]